ncbi:MAG TPA: RNA chaperone Hfq [Spirochaetota bacterium]|nr:RNA chaperone Hfq [Spirochaetota bacterium]HOM38765.1 RNA chaperone Hfq [Spirochaetota bacterium]HPQ49563.1 RNA chaperone Hfq [Spirochaetota bacterium]
MNKSDAKNELDKIIKTLEDKVHSIVSEDREGNFLVENKGKTIELMFLNGESIRGELIDIDRSRVILKKDNIEYFFYKHAIKGYRKI